MIYIVVAILLWSTLGLVIRLSGVPIHLLILFSCLISAVLIGILLTATHRRDLPRGRMLALLLVLGPISLANTFSFFYAYKHTTVANTVLTHYTAPIIVAFLAPFFLKERLTLRIAAAVALATAGLWIMLGVSPPEFVRLVTGGDANTAGILAGLFSGFAYAVLIIILRVLAQDVNPLVMTFSQNGFIALLLLPFVEIPPDISSSLWAFGVMGIVHSTIAPVLYFRGIKEVTANGAAILGYLEPLCAIVLGLLFLGEAVRFETIVGGSLILLSGYFTIRQ